MNFTRKYVTERKDPDLNNFSQCADKYNHGEEPSERI